MSLILKSMSSHKKDNKYLLRIVKDYVDANKNNTEVDQEDIKSFKNFVFNELKYTNDTFGHAAGDAYIVRFADVLKRAFEGVGEM